MKISIITVCYNSSNTIEKTIKSVINQKNKNFEYIIIDGESSDDTLKIINKYKKFINKIISEKDNGIFEAMNKGIDFAKGDIIYFLNSDDFLLNNNIINKIQKIFEKNQLDAVFGGVLCFYPETNQTIPRNRKFLENNLKKGIMPP
ncbi:MAG: glycosyltransferase, partial [Candidatus Woesearchaeota archaeon]